MRILSDIYQYTKQHNIGVVDYPIGFAKGVTTRENSKYCIFFDLGQAHTRAELNSVLAHECAHAATGSLHKVDSPYELVARHEHRANRWAAERFLPYVGLKHAVDDGLRLDEIAEMYDVTEDFVSWAFHYYAVNRGYKF